MSRRAIVTGGTGYVGKNLITRLLDEGWNVALIARNRKYIDSYVRKNESLSIFFAEPSDIELFNFVKNFNADVIFHIAGYACEINNTNDIDLLVSSNIGFGVKVLEAGARAGVSKVITTGSHWQHYENSDERDRCLYSATKHAFEVVCRFYSDAYGMQFIHLHLFDVYGDNDNRPKLFNLLINSAETQKCLDMTKGEQYINLIYISDVIDAYMQAYKLLAENAVAPHAVFGVGQNEKITLKELVGKFNMLSSKKVQVNWGKKGYRKREVMLPWTKFEKIPGWQPKVTLDQGICSILNTKTHKDA